LTYLLLPYFILAVMSILLRQRAEKPAAAIFPYAVVVPTLEESAQDRFRWVLA